MFSWKEFKEGKIAVHCDTEEKANDFLKKCENQGLNWRGRKATTETLFDTYDHDTCYDYDVCDSRLFYCDIGYYKSENYKICDWQIRKVKSFKDLKDGEMIGGVKAVLK